MGQPSQVCASRARPTTAHATTRSDGAQGDAHKDSTTTTTLEKDREGATVTKEGTETLQVHRNGHVVLSSPTNTGVSGAETASGAFPIFERFTSTTMTGTNPDGSHYSDPGVPWVSYFNGGDAVHGFDRGSYGSPQSNGCVELPPNMAAKAYPMLSIGTMVVVS